jgi:hypothetical protein
LIRFADSFARAKAGRSNAARIAMMAMTTSNSIKVKALRARREGAVAQCKVLESMCGKQSIDLGGVPTVVMF